MLNQDAITQKVVEKSSTYILKEALRPVQANLERLDRSILDFLPLESETAKHIAAHVFAAGGKRIRPALFFFASRLVGYSGPHFYAMAAVAEFVHTASLLHDDVIDNSTLRRNKPTANSIWGDQASVLVGDLIYARASELMSATNNQDIVSSYAEAIRLMSEGELLQLEHLFSFASDIAKYERILFCKTAALIGVVCQSAALLAGLDHGRAEALKKFGENVGMAFQLIDDALDYDGATFAFGKATLADLKEGKVTLPVILLRDLATQAEIERVSQIINVQKIDEDGIRYVAGLVKKYQTAQITLERAKNLTDEALAHLAIFADCPERQDLETIARNLVRRSL